MRTVLPAVAALLLMAAPARAEVVASAANGFEVRHTAVVETTPAQAWRTLGQIGRWWNDAHTYSGRAANMRMDLRAGGCWCETWADGSVEHGRVVYAQRNQTLRLASNAGPLQEMGLNGILTYSIAPEGDGVRLTMHYRVNGNGLTDLTQIAPVVDQVLGEQFASLTALAAR
ncbi:MAG: SRPBCC domain-containing protein [Hyphomonadaceae bacterium]